MKVTPDSVQAGIHLRYNLLNKTWYEGNVLALPAEVFYRMIQAGELSTR